MYWNTSMYYDKGSKIYFKFWVYMKKIDIVKISFLKWFEYTTCIHDNVPYAV